MSEMQKSLRQSANRRIESPQNKKRKKKRQGARKGKRPRAERREKAEKTPGATASEIARKARKKKSKNENKEKDESADRRMSPPRRRKEARGSGRIASPDAQSRRLGENGRPLRWGGKRASSRRRADRGSGAVGRAPRGRPKQIGRAHFRGAFRRHPTLMVPRDEAFRQKWGRKRREKRGRHAKTRPKAGQGGKRRRRGKRGGGGKAQGGARRWETRRREKQRLENGAVRPTGRAGGSPQAERRSRRPPKGRPRPFCA